jgi:ectoine hydroxylase-related dioxygenase (phytanoyl-CoA dioxygenase family)
MRPITKSEIDHYQEHGVVYLPDLLDGDWVTRMTSAFTEEMFAAPEGLNHIDVGETAEMLTQQGVELLATDTESISGRFWLRTFNWQEFPSVRKLGCNEPMPEAIAELIGSDRLNFYGEQMFFKEAGSLHRTAFHQDAPYFHLAGDQCCTVWMPLDFVDADNGMMGYVRGSHRWDMHAANFFASQAPMPDSSNQQLPDIEGREDEFDVVYYPAKPGDAIVHHVRTVHGSTGNTSSRDRRAFALRYLGDDVRYLEREGTPPDSAKSPSLRAGDLMDSEEFPLVWIRDQGYL